MLSLLLTLVQVLINELTYWLSPKIIAVWERSIEISVARWPRRRAVSRHTGLRLNIWRDTAKWVAGIQCELDHGMPGQTAVLDIRWPNVTITLVN
jgi:hypothetical protein